jgi:hypothetical protein
MNTQALIGGGGGGGTVNIESDTTDDSIDSGGSGGGSIADFRQAVADSGGHDEAYAGATDTASSDADAVVDEADEAQEIVNTTTQSAEEVVDTFEDTQPDPAADDVASDTAVNRSSTPSNDSDGPSVTAADAPGLSDVANALPVEGAAAVVGLGAGALAIASAFGGGS